MLLNLIPMLILTLFLNGIVPWFIANYDQWGAKKKRLSLAAITLVIFLLFCLNIPITLFQDTSFIKNGVYIENPAELFFFITLGVSLFILFLMLLKAGKTRWFISVLGLISLAFGLHILTVHGYIKASLSNDSPSSSLHKTTISLPFTAHYLLLNLAGKTDQIGNQALTNNDLLRWRQYHYLEHLLYSNNAIALEIKQALDKQSPAFIDVIKKERGINADWIKEFEEYNAQ